MLKITRVITENSLWLFNEEALTYVRLPREDAPPSPYVPFTGQWEPYEQFETEPFEDTWKLVVHRPVEWGTGARRRTGPIISWSTDLVDFGRIAGC